MASSSAANIFSASMSFSRETCRMTDGSMIMRNPLSSVRLLRPEKMKPRHPDIAETDIIVFAILLINDGQDVVLDCSEHSGEAPRQKGLPGSARRRTSLHGFVRLDPDSVPDKSAGVVEGVELAVQPGRRHFQRVPVRDFIRRVEQ